MEHGRVKESESEVREKKERRMIEKKMKRVKGKHEKKVLPKDTLRKVKGYVEE